MKNTKACDLVIGLIYVISGLWVIWHVRGFQTVPRGIGPSGYPTVIAILMVVLGAAQVIRSLSDGWPKFSIAIDAKVAPKVVAMVVLSFIYVHVMTYLGFLLLTPFYLFVLMCLFGYKKYFRAAVTSVLVSTCTWVVFAKIFMIFLPEGVVF